MNIFTCRPLTQTTMQHVREAAATLGVHADKNLTESIVKDEFRRRIFDAHPDKGGDPEKAADLIKELNAAKVLLLEWVKEQRVECSTCGGKRFVPSGVFGQVKPCPRCCPS